MRLAPTMTSLDNGLLLGPGRAACDLDLLQKHNVTHVLNVADDVPVPSAVQQAMEYCCLGVGDFGADAGISRVFETALAFVRPVMEGEGAVLVCVHANPPHKPVCSFPPIF